MTIKSNSKLLLAVTSPLSWVFYKGLVGHLRKTGFDPILLSSPGPNLRETAETEGVPYVTVPMEREIAPIKDLISLYKLFRAIRRIRPDIVDASTPKAGLLVGIAAWLARVPCRVYSLHGLRMETATGFKRWLLRCTERIAVACCHQVFCLSPSLRARGIALDLLSPENTVALINGGFGVNLEQFSPKPRGSVETENLRSQLGIAAGSLVIGFVGRFVRDKGILQLLEAFQILRKTYPELSLLMVGGFEDGDPVDRKLRNYMETTPAIIRPGFMPNTAPYFALMDVFVLPTYREGFGQVSIEAQASGVPVVTTAATGAIDSVIDGVTGIVVPIRDSQAIVDAVGKLLADPELRQRMGRLGREWAEQKFRPQVAWDERGELYKELVSHTVPSSRIPAQEDRPTRQSFGQLKEEGGNVLSNLGRTSTNSPMRVLHVTKTSDASVWAVLQATQLVKEGIEVHAVLPSAKGAAVDAWQTSGAKLHFLDCSVPIHTPTALLQTASNIRRLVGSIRPNLIHTHHVTTTLMMRLALGKNHPTPRLFQVPGPLHLEHWHTRNLEIALAGENDSWIASSRFISQLYEGAGIAANRLFLSYYTTDTTLFSDVRTGYLRHKLHLPDHALIVGNINLIYPPKRYLGQRVGLKCHEDIIEAIRIVQLKRKGVWGVLAGGTFGASDAYERKLRAMAHEKGNGRILMPGKLSPQEVAWSWPDFDCAVHVPLSENCGGVVEALLSAVPTVAGEVGGLPEVVQEGRTGKLVPIRRPQLLADAIHSVFDNYNEFRQMAKQGLQLANTMFDPGRCSAEVLSIYRHVLFGEPRPAAFNSEQFLVSHANPMLIGKQSHAPAVGLQASIS
ncbi:MAG: glycosyltransferase [Candidatus Acidiferrum sp.]